jgi:MFS family permease
MEGSGSGPEQNQRGVGILPYAPPPPAPSKFSVGTLRYTKLGLFSVFFWMLWGDLCVNIMETVIPRLVPLHLERLDASKAVIGLVTGSVMAAVELIVNPFVSTISDRTRTRFGRRRPFILLGTPVLALCLLAVGRADSIASGFSFLTALGLSQNAVTIIVLAVLLALFQVFNVIVLATYYYLIADVVPLPVIGSFTAFYRVMGALGGIIFNKFIFQFADTHEWQIYVGCAAIYFVSFLLMGWRVKEGDYPPPPARPEHVASLWSRIAHWCRESFSIAFYQKLYLIGLFYYFALGGAIYTQFLALNDLKMTKHDFGEATAAAGSIALPLFFLLGPLADRFHPLRVGMVGMAMFAASGLACYVGIVDPHSFWVFTILNTATLTIYLGGQISLLPRILPRSHYGQYCAANNTLCAIGKFGGPVACGIAVDLTGQNRVAYLWQAVFGTLAVGAFVLVIRHWKKLGGDAGFVPPQYEDPSVTGSIPAPK